MARYDIEFGKLGDSRPVPDLTVQTTDPDVLGRTVADHARPYITPVLAEMGHPEYADCLFRTTPDRSMGEFLWLDLAGARGVAFLAARITTTPERIQRKRTKGWTAPNGAKYVGRGTRWGNPFTITRDGEHHIVTNPDGGVILTRNSSTRARKAAADWYRAWITGPSQEDLRAAVHELRGRDLMCWCPLPADGEPDHCHAAVLLRLAAGEEI
ncbi:DUF4326 domain-containing protein (plasmid) [Streptomyces sp. NBC_01590]|uniref:DUF4326 domain-containing protein n=1 Tax=Streptomyces sp. NBC_01590 TaxID=2975887 RepID=UPI002F91355F